MTRRSLRENVFKALFRMEFSAPEEKEEQAALRKAYVANIRAGLKAQLDNIDIQEADGSVTNLGEQYREKHGE